MGKISNSIVVGGPTAAGKSSLVGSLGYEAVFELNNNDEMQELLISKMYSGDKIASKIFQFDLIMTRHDKYRDKANKKNMHVFDRTILEDYIFAKKLFGEEPIFFEYYEKIWKYLVHEMIKKIGRPKLYILITCSWVSFKKRIFDRNRDFEIKNFEKKKLYFREMLKTYIDDSITILNHFQIPYYVLDTSKLSRLEVVSTVKKHLHKVGIND